MLYSVGRVLETDEDRDHEVFAAGGQGSKRIFHVGSSGLVHYLEISRGIGLKERLQELAGLVAAAVAGVGEDRDLQIVCEPCRKLIGITSGHVLGYGHKYFITPVLG